MDSNRSSMPAPPPCTIVFASNERGVLPLSLALWSLLKNASDSTTYDVYVLSDGIQQSSREHLRKIAGDIHLRHSLDFIDTESILEQKIQAGFTSYLPRSTWARIFAPELLPHVNRALYADIDILVCDDCSSLFTLDMQGAALGVVYESASSPTAEVYDRLDIPREYPGYFNAGVLLMDFEQFRTCNIAQKILAVADKYNGKLYAQDQDALNAALYDNVIRLHPRWNWHDRYTRTSLFANPSSKLWRAFEPREVVEASLFPGIIHFIGAHKPWHYTHRLMARNYETAIKESGLPGFLPLPGWNFKTWLARLLYSPMYALTWHKIKRLAKKWGIASAPAATTWGLAKDLAKTGHPPQS